MIALIAYFQVLTSSSHNKLVGWRRLEKFLLSIFFWPSQFSLHATKIMKNSYLYWNMEAITPSHDDNNDQGLTNFSSFNQSGSSPVHQTFLLHKINCAYLKDCNCISF
jgi:hypothetical protein